MTVLRAAGTKGHGSGSRLSLLLNEHRKSPELNDKEKLMKRTVMSWREWTAFGLLCLLAALSASSLDNVRPGQAAPLVSGGEIRLALNCVPCYQRCGNAACTICRSPNICYCTCVQNLRDGEAPAWLDVS